jgi:hypothetical protein
MEKLKVSTREIGTVCVFDLEGVPTQDTLQEVAWKIQRNIRRHRLQRIILNLQHLRSLDDLGMRKLLAACIRPQKSLIYGASAVLVNSLEDSYLPRNVRICPSEKEVAEDLGPFLLEKETTKAMPIEGNLLPQDSIGYQLERRRSKRMHVALPLELSIIPDNGKPPITARAIATNISDGGLFAEYLDLEAAHKIDQLDPIADLRVEINIFPSTNFPEEYQVIGKIKRKDLRKKQLGLGVEFLNK